MPLDENLRGGLKNVRKANAVRHDHLTDDE
jgi:hypothetical protein